MSEYKLKPGKIGEKAIGAYQKVENAFVDRFLDKGEDGNLQLKTGKTGEAAVRGYQKVEDAVVGAYQKIENAFAGAFLEKVDDKRADPQPGARQDPADPADRENR